MPGAGCREPDLTGPPRVHLVRRVRRVRRVVGVLAAVLCLGYFGSQASRYSGSLAELHWTCQLSVALAGALALQLGSALLDAWSWGWLLRMLQVPAAQRRAIAIFSVAQFAKYLPGNVAQHVGRVVLGRSAGWQTERVALSVVIESSFSLGAGGLMAGAGLLLVGAPAGGTRLLVSAVILTLGWLAGVIVLRAVLAHPPQFLEKRLALHPPLQLRRRVLFLYFGIHLVSYAAMGLAFALLLRGLAGNWPPGVWRVPTGVAIAWLAGYVVPGAPAGLGVREAVLTGFLSPHIEPGIVLSAVLLWRAVSLVADALLALFGLWLRPGAAPVPRFTRH